MDHDVTGHFPPYISLISFLWVFAKEGLSGVKMTLIKIKRRLQSAAGVTVTLNGRSDRKRHETANISVLVLACCCVDYEGSFQFENEKYAKKRGILLKVLGSSR